MIVIPDPSRPIILGDSTMADPFRRWTVEVSNLSLITGSGSPEGVVSAIQGREYMDTAGTAGAIKYIKRDSDILGDRTQGWILI